MTAWRDEYRTMSGALAECITTYEDATAWSVVFEFELPFEGGRRPDVVVLAGETIAVLEFKGDIALPVAYFDQVKAYARDLADYHAASHDKLVVPILVSTASETRAHIDHEVNVERPDTLAGRLLDVAEGGRISLAPWLAADYAPLPTLVDAARRIFANAPLPHVRRALSARVPETVDLVARLIAEARETGCRRLVLLTGVPGAGKTLVGLRVVYEKSGLGADATFLSGNGPLVKVLQDALSSRVFVRDLHKFILDYGLSDRVPTQHV
ncbi:MAG TPA: DNA/RNA helicase domain-containing protein, partial [Thermoleophilaceae bacterium]|nr:DNA/RNA helicase domain-containing protein [Thermoleophilaceae bacterium]